ncbi:MAG: PLP-dependent aminotransferase family protein [Melioribacteraceae bacterium]|nr:PLP-dependent aminotransferase family protein [Melioribacteraceae bacterium]
MYPFSQSVGQLRTSEIRDLMKLATRPDIISFAGGMPNNDLFPTEAIDEIYKNLPKKIKQAGFQYGPTSGYPPLIEAVKDYLRTKGLPVDENELMITTGSLQAINIVTKVFIDPGDRIITETPCFIGGTSAFKSYQAEIDPVPIDEDGIIIEELEKKLNQKPAPKIVYLTPYFHNPAGIIYSRERKQKVMDLMKGRNIILLEDDPYGEIYFNETDKDLTVPMKVNETDDLPICYTGSFSKILGPGMRLGWLLAKPEIFQKCELVKQSMDACSPTFTQVLANEFLRQNKLEPYLAFLRETYKRRMDIMQNCLEETMPKEVKWVKPKGGFYMWFHLPEGIDATEILKDSIEKGAVFVVGKTFDPHGVKNNWFRLAFSHTPEDKIHEGVEIIANAVKKFI